MFVTDRNSARYLGQTYCVQKCKKFHHSSTLKFDVKYGLRPAYPVTKN